MRLILGDCREKLAALDADSVHSVVCDPPYELGFMGKSWDKAGVSFDPATWKAILRVAKPGAHLVAFGGTRTYHRIAVAIEDAGWQIRDSLIWLHGQGFPKSLDIGKAIDDVAGAEREVVGTKRGVRGADGTGHESAMPGKATGIPQVPCDVDITAPATPQAKRWQGWGTALKPAYEPIILARKPFAGTVAACVLEHGTGGINVGACRVGNEKIQQHGRRAKPGGGWDDHWHNDLAGRETGVSWRGRWPANLLLSCCDTGCPDCPRRMLDEQSGDCPTGVGGITRQNDNSPTYTGPASSQDRLTIGYGDTGGASRFFYCAKPSRAEREYGCDALPPKSAGEMTDRKDGSDGLGSPRAGTGRTGGARNTHPTLKSIALMRWLCRLVTPPKGTVLDPFMGSGTTGMACAAEGFGFIGVELRAEYMRIAKARIEWASSHPAELDSDEEIDTTPQVGQMGLFT